MGALSRDEMSASFRRRNAIVSIDFFIYYFVDYFREWNILVLCLNNMLSPSSTPW